MKKTKMMIAIDCGKMNVKIRCNGMKMIYPNRYSEGHTDEGMIGDMTFNVTYNDREYSIGRNGNRNISSESKADDMHIISALVAITHFIPEEGAEVYVMYGESANMYFNQAHKQEIIDKLMGKHQLTVDGKTFTFSIVHAHILPEGIGHIIDDLKNNMGMQYVVDIGGTTINFLSVMNGRPYGAEEGSFSFVLGVQNIIANIRQKLSVEGVGRFSPNLITQFITDGCDSEVVKDIIFEAIHEQFKKLDQELDAYGVNIHNLLKIHKVTFIGGGSDLFKDYITNYYNGATVINDGVWANVNGFYKYGCATVGDKVKAGE